jgi:hypothetical protein
MPVSKPFFSAVSISAAMCRHAAAFLGDEGGEFRILRAAACASG